MKKNFVNFTNHPSDRWSQEQLQAALKYGEIVDIPFPEVPATADENTINKMAREYHGKIMEQNPAAVLCQGEFCLAFQVISLLQRSGVTVLAACSERNVKSEDNGRKITVFEFKRFRKY